MARRRTWGVLALLLAGALARADAPAGVKWVGVTEIASGGGERGEWRQNDSRYDYVDDGTVDFDTQGRLCVAWVDQKSKDVFFRRLGGGPPVNVSRNPATFSWLPRIATAPDDPDTVYLLWQEIVFSGGSHGGEILFARSDDGGKTFSAPLNLSRSQGGDGKGRLDRATWSNGSLDLAASGDGTMFVAWTEYHGALWFARSGDGGRSFSRPQRMAGDDARPARGPALAAGPGRTVHLAWTVGEADRAAIHVAQSEDGGIRFGRPRLVGGGGHADAPSLAVDNEGDLHLVYAESPTGRGGRYQIRYAQARTDGRGFGPPRTIAEGGAYPTIEADGQGGLYVTWEMFGRIAQRPQGLGMTVSRDGGRSFAPPATVPGSRDPLGGTNGSHQGLLGKKLAVDFFGNIAVINSSLQPGERSRVWLMRGHAPR